MLRVAGDVPAQTPNQPDTGCRPAETAARPSDTVGRNHPGSLCSRHTRQDWED